MHGWAFPSASAWKRGIWRRVSWLRRPNRTGFRSQGAVRSHYLVDLSIALRSWTEGVEAQKWALSVSYWAEPQVLDASAPWSREAAAMRTAARAMEREVQVQHDCLADEFWISG